MARLCDDGMTALHYAAKHSTAKLWETLLLASVNPAAEVVGAEEVGVSVTRSSIAKTVGSATNGRTIEAAIARKAVQMVPCTHKLTSLGIP